MQLKRIVVGTDFSEHSHEAMRHALGIAERAEAAIRVVHAQTGVPRFGTEPTSELVNIARKRLDTETAPWTDRGIPLAQQFVSAPPPLGILSAATEFQANLIVVGSQGRTGISRLLMGSVAEKVARRAACDVLVVRGSSPKARYRQLLVPTDFSERSKPALARAHELIEDGGTIHLLHCWEQPNGKVEYWTANAASLRENMRLAAEELGAAMQPSSANALGSVVLLQKSSEAQDGILEALSEEAYDLVVMGSHSRTGVGRWFMGSVAEATLRHASVPVYIARQQGAPD